MRLLPLLFLLACSSQSATPRVTAVVPGEVCAAGGEVVTVEGSGFSMWVESALDVPRVVASRARLGALDAETRFVSSTELAVVVPVGAARGAVDVEVENPDGQRARLASGLTFIDGPSVSGVEPAEACGGKVVTVRGAGFELAPLPRVTVDGVPLVVTNPSGCGASRCAAFEVALPATLAPGSHVLAVENPAASSCPGAAESPAFTLLAGPTVSSLEPDRCEAPSLLTIRGAGFPAGATVTVNGAARPIERVDDGTLRVILEAGDLDAAAAVAVHTPDGCATELTAAAAGHGVQPISVVPDAVSNDAATRVTIGLALGGGAPSRVALRSGATEVVLETVAAVAGRGEVQATIPAGIAAGTYDVVVGSDACKGVLANGLRVAGETSLELVRILPAFGQAGRETAVRVEAAAPGFDGLPALVASGGGQAAALRGVALASPTAATAVVPALPAGEYDIVAVTPSGKLGVLRGAFRVSATPPPLVDAVNPSTLVAGRDTRVVIQGSGFASDATVTLSCGARTLVVASRTATEIAATAPADLEAGSVCTLRVTNGDPSSASSAWDELAGLVVRQPSANIDEFSPAAPLVEPRRAPAAVAVEVTREARYLVVIGGDGGSRATPRASVESAAIAPDGTLGTFTVQRQALTTARTFAGAARVDDFVYVVGGASAAAALDTVERARVLSPGDVPEAASVALAAGPGPGAGSWVYRVAALRADGETLPSEPIRVTATAGQKVTVAWQKMVGATGYRIYRTPAPGQAPAAALLLAALGDTAEVVDDGTREPQAGRPLEQGALGVWQVVASRLTRPRQGHAVVAASAGDGRAFLYALGGAGDELTAPAESYEVARVGATLGAFASQPLAGARVFPGAAVVAGSGERLWVYLVGGGRISILDPLDPEADDKNSIAGQVGAEGVLAIEGVKGPKVAGAATVAAAGSLFAIGGVPPDDKVLSAALGATPAELGNWNSSGGGRLVTPRALAAAVVERGFIYVVGGAGAGGALSSTERTRW